MTATVIVLIVTVICLGAVSWMGKVHISCRDNSAVPSAQSAAHVQGVITILFASDEQDVKSEKAKQEAQTASLLTSDALKPEPQKEQPAKADTAAEDSKSEGQASSSGQDQNCCAKFCGGMCTCFADSASTPANLGEPKEEIVFFHLLEVRPLALHALTPVRFFSASGSWGWVRLSDSRLVRQRPYGTP